MAVVKVEAGACGHTSIVRARRAAGSDRRTITVTVESTCPDVQAMAPELGEVDAFRQIDLRAGMPPVMAVAFSHCRHAACPVPVALVKAIEVAAGLALARDVHLTIRPEDEVE